MPAGWRDRLVRFENEATHPARGWCLEAHDLVIAKLVRGDPKDQAFAGALVGADLVRRSELRARLALTDTSPEVRARISKWIGED